MRAAATPIRADHRTLARDILVAAGASAAIAALTFARGWGEADGLTEGALTPPDWLTAVVWVGLFALLGFARWRLRFAAGALAAPARRARRCLDAVLLLCLGYKLSMLTSGNIALGFAGDVVIAALAAVTALLAWRASRLAAALVLPLLPWLAYAILLMLAELGAV